jgi:hypothetical protein
MTLSAGRVCYLLHMDASNLLCKLDQEGDQSPVLWTPPGIFVKQRQGVACDFETA